MRIRSVLAATVAGALLFSGVTAFATTEAASAATGGQFNPGMIISDALFFDGAAMSPDVVQNFLSSQVRTCSAGYTCLKDYRTDTVSRPANGTLCAPYTGATAETAATIIAKVGVACGISQKALLVLLQKEQGLVTSTAPSAGKYRAATGYGCPDTSACDSTYYGFYNQVYMAALQFKRYAAAPTRWNHVAGRVNSIRLHPNAACGAASVLIQNQATAGLYNYTPYTPNSAALNNLYGTGDGCSSYGNRNFWRYYTDWFGSTTTSTLLRSPDDPTVYLVVDTIKYPVQTYGLYLAFSPLGAASIVSQSYLDSLTTSHPATRVIRTSDGAIYFIDSAIKLQFSSCDQVVDYGGSCADTGYVNITNAQAAAFHTGPAVSPVLGTQEGARYLLDDGTKREVLDNESQAGAGLAPGFNVLTEGALADLPYGTPIIRDSVFVKARESSDYSLIAGAVRYPVAQADIAPLGVATRSAGAIHAAALAKLTASNTQFNGEVTANGYPGVNVLAQNGRYALTEAAHAAASTSIPVAAPLVASYPDLGTIAAGSFVKATTGDTVYVVTPTQLRPVGGWASLVALANTPSPEIVPIAATALAPLQKGTLALGPGMMYRSPENAQIYLIDGLSNRIPVTNFDITTAAGFTTWTYAPQNVIDSYTQRAALSYGIRCGTTNYVSVGGVLRPVPAGSEGLFAFGFMQLDALTCARATVGVPAIDFIRTADGSIYQLVGGTKHHISAAKLAGVNGGKGWMQVADGFALQIPTGAPI